MSVSSSSSSSSSSSGSSSSTSRSSSRSSRSTRDTAQCEEDAIEDLRQRELALPASRAMIRFRGGTKEWKANMYMTRASKRVGDAEYNEKQRLRREERVPGCPEEGWKEYDKWLADNPKTEDREKEEKRKELKIMTFGDLYNLNRRKQNQKALEDMLAAGLYVKKGRPALPPGAAAIPKAAIEPISLDEMVILGEPNAFKNVDYQIKIPNEYVRVAAYLGVSVINVDQAPLKWGMFRFSTWDELKKSSRNGYLYNARAALAGVVGYISNPPESGPNGEKVRRYLEYSEANDKYYLDLEKDLVDDVAEGEDEEPIVVADADVAPKPPRPEKKRPRAVDGPVKAKKLVWSRNPIRIVEFMLAVNMDPFFVVQETSDQAYTIANARASALASVCYTYLRYLLKNKQEKSDVFRKVLNWSHIFERYTRVAKRITGDKHASQQTTQEKLENTAEWSLWREKAMEFIQRYFVITDQGVKIRTRKEGFTPWWPGHPDKMRLRKAVLDDKDKEVELREKDLLPWWRASYAETEKDRDAPNLRELRDAVMVAVYSLLAPIRLDWATVEIMDTEGFNKFKLDKQANDEAKVAMEGGAPAAIAAAVAAPVKGRRKKFNINIIVVDDKKNPTRADMAYFGQMKNIDSFNVKPVPKYVRSESPLCEQLILAFLRERNAVGFKSHCLFPFSTYRGNELRGQEEGVKAMNCFSNSALGERLADLAWDLVRKNFTETLMRRSYITWFWTNTDAKGRLVNDPLNTDVWNKLLPSVHQNSKDANLGYIKGVLKDFQDWLAAHPKASVIEREAKRRELSTKALTEEGAYENTAEGQDPEVDSDDKKNNRELQAVIAAAKKEEAAKVNELRRSRRLAKEPVEPQGAQPPQPLPPKAQAPKAAQQVAVPLAQVAAPKKVKAQKAAPPPPPPPPAPKPPAVKKVALKKLVLPKKKPEPAPEPVQRPGKRAVRKNNKFFGE